jgi:hypothetical protein
MKTSKSAFDFLMRNVKAKQQEQQQTILEKLVTTSDDDVIIINNNNNTNEENKKQGKNQIENIPETHEIILKTEHIQQFS